MGLSRCLLHYSQKNTTRLEKFHPRLLLNEDFSFLVFVHFIEKLLLRFVLLAWLAGDVILGSDLLYFAFCMVFCL
jgi:hypothetical protein